MKAATGGASRAMARAATTAVGLGLAAFAAMPRAHAEGSAQTGFNQRLDLTNYNLTLKVDAVAGETITIAGRMVSNAGGLYPWAQVANAAMSVVITTPSGQRVTLPLASGAGLLTVNRIEDLPRDLQNEPFLPTSGANAPRTYLAAQTGTYHLAFRQTSGAARVDLLPYDVSVTPSPTIAARPFRPPNSRGRLHSTRWGFDAGAFLQTAATNAQYFVQAPGATPGSSYIWNMDLQGLAGYVYDVIANDTGLDAPYSRSSRSRWITPEPKNTPLYEIYLTPPEAINPAVRPSVAFTGASGNGITLEGLGGTFRFRSNLSGSYQLIVDANRDNVFDGSTGSADAILAGRTLVGVNDSKWNGKDATGKAVPAGTYAAKLFLRVGEFHFVAYDDENNYPGLAIKRVDATSLASQPAIMYWDDRQVPVPDGSRRSGGGVPAVINTLPNGVMSNVTRHAWGNTWVSNSFGNEAYVDTWVIGDEDSVPLTITIRAPQADADGDTIANVFDEYPCDPNKASSVFVPSQSSMGMVMYEDLWPSDGDFDFNDTVIAYNYEIIYNRQETITAIRANFNVIAIGASLHSGLGLALPIPAAAVSQIHRRIGEGGVDLPVVRSSDGNLVVHVINDLRQTFSVADQYINTRPAEPVTRPRTISVLVELAQPVALRASDAPFDLFLYWTHDPSHEIHRPMYAGTLDMDTTLFGTESDGSTETRHFVNHQGVPFALDVPVSTLYPVEKIPIDWLYPDILAFGTSGGATAKNYYATNVQLVHAFTGDVFGTARAAAVIPPRVEVYDTQCQRIFE
jgi:LruC domain-containing protein